MPALEAPSLVELAVRRLRAEIVGGAFAPGERLVEEQRATSTSCSTCGTCSSASPWNASWDAAGCRIPTGWPSPGRRSSGWRDDRVVVRYTVRATHSGELFGAPPTGRSVTFTGVEIYRLAGSRIAEYWGEADMSALFAGGS
jgi:hypothetical protein